MLHVHVACLVCMLECRCVCLSVSVGYTNLRNQVLICSNQILRIDALVGRIDILIYLKQYPHWFRGFGRGGGANFVLFIDSDF